MPKKITAYENPHLGRLAVRDHFISTRAVVDQWFTEHGRHIGIQTAYHPHITFHTTLLEVPCPSKLTWPTSGAENGKRNQECNTLVYSTNLDCLNMHYDQLRVKRKHGWKYDPYFLWKNMCITVLELWCKGLLLMTVGHVWSLSEATWPRSITQQSWETCSTLGPSTIHCFNKIMCDHM